MEQFQQKNNSITREIDLVVPLLPEMVRIVRLTVSGIASRIGFQIDEIEDIKVAVAEICNRIITKTDPTSERCFIRFTMGDEQLKVSFSFENRKPEEFELFDEEDILGISIVNSLVDEVDVNYSKHSKEIITLSMFLKEN
ncbi:MAG: serine/threonine-protein kinase RsbW [Petroclostridium sp.]|jgi:serine/threonine-protein kinase RsbW|uniref:ATP-binding protein n=1 Tax=Petroclostridium xylanilyticum TaxID=1792311 RepID=UPI000B988B82|nr:ATP-binding protein [Petroclostridium xylanilyticum]MBZ4645757.1 anti-sigma regulatory factor [Clostridia bacterium]MDK2811539.1 serine/threonine-protein kinase RsbW [Petroclostridium sp.]